MLPPNPGRVAQGEALQLPVYALAAEQAFPGSTTVAAAYHTVTHDPRKAGAVALEGADLDGARAALLAVASTVDAGVRGGRFVATPSKETCAWCDFTAICGPGRAALWDRKRNDPRASDVRALQQGPAEDA